MTLVPTVIEENVPEILISTLYSNRYYLWSVMQFMCGKIDYQNYHCERAQQCGNCENPHAPDFTRIYSKYALTLTLYTLQCVQSL